MSTATGRHRPAAEPSGEQDPAGGGAPQVLFVYAHNAGRSQMAAALLTHHAAGTAGCRGMFAPI